LGYEYGKGYIWYSNLKISKFFNLIKIMKYEPQFIILTNFL